MPDLRVRPSVVERADIDLRRRPRPRLAARRRATWLCGAVALAGLCGYWGASGDNRVFQTRPVARVHRSFENDCRQCHVSWCRPLQQLVRGDEVLQRSVAACRQCHRQHHHDHHRQSIDTSVVQDCGVCHREHHGADGLARVDDARCTVCHQSLETASGKPPRFAARVTSFAADHPGFAIHRSEPPDAGHQALQVAEFRQGAWRDRAAIRFNHQAHLAPEGVPLPGRGGEAASRLRALHCGDCHQPTADGRYMQPIEYERHCQQCHTLDFAEPLVAGADGTIGPLPHESLEIIRGLLRDRLAAYVQRRGVPPPRPGRQPGQLRPPQPTDDAGRDADADAAAKWQYVESRLRELDEHVGGRRDGGPPGSLARVIGQGCQFCHVAEEAPDGTFPWRLRPTNIPGRWLPHSRFRHDSHEAMTCAACHFRGPAGADVDAKSLLENYARQRQGQPVSDAFEASVFHSTSTGDILLPGIEVCRRCHGSGREQAGDSCAACHGYHGRTAGE